MTPSQIALCASLSLAALPFHARAQDAPSEQEHAHADTSFSVGEIIVTARGMAGNTGNVLTSVDRLGGDVAQRADVTNAYELIARVPGVQLTEFNQGTTSGKFSMRGFNGEGNINAVKLLVDGVPSNSNDGNMPYIDMVSPLSIETIEVVRGTSDPRYGLHAIAGSANIVTRSGSTYFDARGSVGSYNAVEGQLSAGLERGAFSQNYQLFYRESDGYRDHGHSRRWGLSGKWNLALGEQVSLGAIARYYDAQAQEAGYLTFASSRADRRMTNAYNTSDGDERSVQQYALKLDISFSDRIDWSSTAWSNRFEDDRFVKFSAGAAQQRRLTNEDHHGLSTALHWHGDLAGMPLMLEAGSNVEWQDNHSLRWSMTQPRQFNDGNQTRNQQFELTVGGVYVQAIIEPAAWVRITPAWRIDWVGGQFNNRLASTKAPANDYGSIDQPKLSVALMPAKGVTVYGNWGKSFQIGLGSGAYLIPPRQRDLAPSINEGWEAGIKYQFARTIEARIAYWEQSATGEIARKLNDPLGDFENVGATNRKGADVQLSLRLREGLSLWGALSWQKATIQTPPPQSPQNAGNQIDHTPRWLWSGGIDYQPMERLTLSLNGRGQSSYYLTAANAEGQWGQMALFDASALFRASHSLELGLTVRNLTGDKSEYVWWDGTQTLHSPAPGRSFTASARLRY